MFLFKHPLGFSYTNWTGHLPFQLVGPYFIKIVKAFKNNNLIVYFEYVSLTAHPIKITIFDNLISKIPLSKYIETF